MGLVEGWVVRLGFGGGGRGLGAVIDVRGGCGGCERWRVFGRGLAFVEERVRFAAEGGGGGLGGGGFIERGGALLEVGLFWNVDIGCLSGGGFIERGCALLDDGLFWSVDDGLSLAGGGFIERGSVVVG